MSDLERRALLGAASLGAIAAMAKAGPLNPPAGAVAPTGRTNDEIYNKIPTLPSVGAFDGRIPIPGSTSGVSISAPGSYVLTGDLTVTSGTGLNISSSNVTVDLNGFRIANTSTTSNCIAINSASTANVAIRNGLITGGFRGIIVVGSGINGVTLEDLVIVGARTDGILAAQSANRNFQIRRCRVCDTGITTTAADAATAVTGIALSGDAHHIDECTVSRLYNFTPGGVVRGITLSIDGANSGCLVSRCLVNHDAGITGTGMQFGGFTVYRDNTVMNFSVPYSAVGATNGGGNV